MRLTERVRVSSEIVTRELGEETMLLHLASGTYYGLDTVGARFFSFLEQGKSALEARDALLDLYDVDPAILDRDLEALLDNLSSNGIVEARS